MSVVSATDIRPGMLITFEGKLHSVMKTEHRTPGNKRGFVKARLREVDSGASFEHKFSSTDSLEQVSLDNKEMEFLYEEAGVFHFMDTSTYEQVALPADVIGDAAQYMLPNTQLRISFYEGKPMSVDLPTSVELTVTETEPAIKGATQAASKKPATLETGLVVLVPQYIESGTRIKVDTRDGSYLDRA